MRLKIPLLPMYNSSYLGCAMLELKTECTHPKSNRHRQDNVLTVFHLGLGIRTSVKVEIDYTNNLCLTYTCSIETSGE